MQHEHEDAFGTDRRGRHRANVRSVARSIDDGGARQLITDKLSEYGVPFIDVGMGLYEQSSMIGGQVRLTTSTANNRAQARARLPLVGTDPNNEYRTNVQIADLNALNAAH